MNISDQIKGTIALFVLTAWFLLYGVSLSLDMDQKTDVTPVVPKSIRLANVDVVTNLQTSISLLDFTEYCTPPCGPKFLSSSRPIDFNSSP
jgi:hypothetical protein